MDILYKFKRSNKEYILSNAKNVYNAKISELFSKYRFLQLITVISLLICIIYILLELFI